MSDYRGPFLIDKTREQKIQIFSLIIFIISLLILSYIYSRYTWWPSKNKIFSQIYRKYKKTNASTENLEAFLKSLHHGLDTSLGKTVFLDNLELLYQKNASFKNIEEEINDFFRLSRLIFFGKASKIDQSNAYATQITDAVGAGNSLSSQYDMNNGMAVQLQNVAKMISGGLKTKVYILNINGFDTHDSQADVSYATVGVHADLLTTVSDAVSAFQDDLSLLGLEDRVIGMTFSEFGRQIASNASIGTDHGDAAPMFLFGSCLNNQVLGMNPVVSDTIVSQAGIPFEYDFRNIYASILKDWFLAPEAQIQAMFEQTVNFIPLANSCNNFSGIDENEAASSVKCYPNPSVSTITLEFNSLNEDVSVGIYDAAGSLVREIFSKSLYQEKHTTVVDISNLKEGNYRFLILKESGKETASFIKIDK